MLHYTHQAALALHVVSGSCALLLFWAPMLSRKGGVVHRKSGRWYYRAMMLVAVSALLLCTVILIDPVSSKAAVFTDPQAQAQYIERSRLFALFLAQLAVMLYTNLHFGTWVLHVRADRAQLRSARHLGPLAALVFMSLYSGMLGVQRDQILLQGFALLGLFTASSNWRYVFAAEVPSRAAQAMHVRNIIPSGIAAYTAFFVVGASSFLGDSNWRLIPWVAPGVLGSVVIYYYSRKVLQGRTRGDNSHLPVV